MWLFIWRIERSMVKEEPLNLQTLKHSMSKFQLLIVFSAFALGLYACTGSDDDFPVIFENAPVNPDKAMLLQLVNQARAEGRNCGGNNLSDAPPLTWNDTLALVARKHSQDMAANDRLSHIGSDGSFVDERLTREGYTWTFYAENLLKGVSTEKAAIETWLESQAHCENIMNPKLRQFGVGTSGPYWTMVLAGR